MGVSPGTSVTGSFGIWRRAEMSDSSDFAISVHAYAVARWQSDEQPMAIEIGGLTLTLNPPQKSTTLPMALWSHWTVQAKLTPSSFKLRVPWLPL
jgi:hypothetical protein